MRRFFQQYWQRAALVLAIALLPIGVAAKSQYDQQNYVYVPKDQVIEGNLYRAGEAVVVEGNVNGDVIVAGGIVKIAGAVSGDVIAVGGRVYVSGPVQGDLRAIGGVVTVDSVIGKNATIAAGNVFLNKGSAIGWEALIMTGMLEMEGRIQKDLRGIVGGATINGPIGRDVWLKVGRPNQLVLQPQATIGGDLSYLSPTAAKILSGATIQGEVMFHEFTRDPQQAKAAVFALAAFKLMGLLSLWIVGIVLIWLAPKAVEKANRHIEKDGWEVFGYGLIGVMGTPMAIVLLAVSLVGLPLALLLTASYIWFMLVGLIIASTYLGERLLRKFGKRPWQVSLNWSMTLGVFIIVLLSCLPFIGGFVKLIAVALGAGSLLLLKKEELKKWR